MFWPSASGDKSPHPVFVELLETNGNVIAIAKQSTK